METLYVIFSLIHISGGFIMKKIVIFVLLILSINLLIYSNFIEDIQYYFMSDEQKEVHEVIESQIEISNNFIEDIGHDIVKLESEDLNNLVLASGEKVEIEINGTLGNSNEVTIDVLFENTPFPSTTGIIDDYKIHVIEIDSINTIMLFSRSKNDNEYTTFLWRYNGDLIVPIGFFTHINGSLYYDNSGNILFYSDGVKSEEYQKDESVELEYYYNIDNMLSKRIKDKNILKILREI